jgi:hypothetical protein
VTGLDGHKLVSGLLILGSIRQNNHSRSELDIRIKSWRCPSIICPDNRSSFFKVFKSSNPPHWLLSWRLGRTQNLFPFSFSFTQNNVSCCC